MRYIEMVSKELKLKLGPSLIWNNKNTEVL
jgi:hypothetical protein